jgi:hypothetical protein
MKRAAIEVRVVVYAENALAEAGLEAYHHLPVLVPVFS